MLSFCIQCPKHGQLAEDCTTSHNGPLLYAEPHFRRQTREVLSQSPQTRFSETKLKIRARFKDSRLELTEPKIRSGSQAQNAKRCESQAGEFPAETVWPRSCFHSQVDQERLISAETRQCEKKVGPEEIMIMSCQICLWYLFVVN